MSETPFPVSAPPPDAASLAALLQSAAQALLRSGTSSEEHPAPAKAVSYTHLTLPTNSLV